LPVLQTNMIRFKPQKLLIKWLCIVLISLNLSACLGTAVGVVVDTAIEVVKVPFKVGGAVIDVMTDDKDEKDDEKKQ